MSDKRTIVVVQWEDITQFAGWTDGGLEYSVEKKPAVATSVGFLVHKDRRYLYIATDHSTDQDWGGLQCIPRGCISSIKTIGRA
jgi:hypothetical protein